MTLILLMFRKCCKTETIRYAAGSLLSVFLLFLIFVFFLLFLALLFLLDVSFN